MTTIELFNETFIKHQQTIKNNGKYKYKLTSDESEEIMQNIYISISNTFHRNPDKYNMNEKEMLKYIYYSYSSHIKSCYRNNKIEFEEYVNQDMEDDTKDAAIETGKDLFFQHVFEYLYSLSDKKYIRKMNIEIYKYYLYNNLTVIQISNRLNIKRFVVDYSIRRINWILRESSVIQKLKDKYLVDTL